MVELLKTIPIKEAAGTEMVVLLRSRSRAAAETVMAVLLLIGARMDRDAVIRVMMIEKE